jgi:hypothetical protein
MVKRSLLLGPMLVVVLAALQLQVVSGSRLTTNSHCSILDYPLVTLNYDPETASYRLQSDEDLSDGGNSTRFLRLQISRPEDDMDRLLRL